MLDFDVLSAVPALMLANVSTTHVRCQYTSLSVCVCWENNQGAHAEKSWKSMWFTGMR